MKAALLLNFGGPSTLDEVRPFLEQLFSDPVILPFPGPLRRRLARLISRKRSPVVVEQYRLIGGGSTLVADTFALVRELVPLVEPELRLYAAMAYTPPFVGETVERLLAEGAEELVCLGLFPHYSAATTGTVFESVRAALRRRGARLPVHYVPAWHENPGYLEAQVERIRDGLAKLPDGGRGTHLLFSAHGLPVSFLRRRDPYQRQVQQNVRDVLRRLGWEGGASLAYQSKVGPVRWLSPSTDEEIERLAAAGVRRVFVVPVSFVSEHIETLYEIDHLYGDRSRSLGIEVFARMEALGTHPRFVEGLAELLRRALRGGFRDRCVRCLLPREPEHFRRKRCPDCRFVLPAFQREKGASRE